MFLDRSDVSQNSTTSTGGGLELSGTATITGSTVSGNSAGSYGGGIYTFGTTTFADSTISGNTSAGYGGGILSSNAALFASNVTISGNSATGGGGGLYQVTGGTALLRNATVFGNHADSDGAGGESGGGIDLFAADAVTLDNTIVAGNVRGSGAGTANDVSGPLAAGSSYNLIADAGSAGGLANGARGNIVGIDWHGVLDPVLRNSGGPTLTHALLVGSAARDAGSDAQALDPKGNPLAFDQRGAGFPRVLRRAVDIGAFELANSGPAARDDTFFTIETVTGNVLGDNGAGADADADGDSLTVTAVNGVAAGVGDWITLASGSQVRVGANGDFEFRPAAGYEALQEGDSIAETFTYTVSDGFGGSSTATVTVTINGENDAPVARNDAIATDEDTPVSGDLFADDGSGSDYDVDGGPLAVVAVNGVAADVGGWVTLASGTLLRVNADGTFTFDPNGAYEALAAGQSAGETFTYTVGDGLGGSATATVTLTVNGINDAPVARNDEFSTTEDTATFGDLFADNGHGTDSDAEGDSLTITAVNGVAVGVGTTVTLASGALLTVNADGTFSYDPNGKFDFLAVGGWTADTFTYVISDDQGGTSGATVMVRITGVNDRPTASPDSLEVDEDGRLVVSGFRATELTMWNDIGDWAEGVSAFHYTPASAAFSAAKNFDNGVTLRVSQSPGGDWFFLNFAAADDLPLTTGDYPNAVRFPFQGPGQPGLSVIGIGRGDNTLTGRFTVYELVSGDDGEVLRFAATFEEHGDEQIPALRGTITYNSTFGQTGGVLANDSDPEGAPLQMVLVTGPAHGALSFDENGSLVYTPDRNFNGIDSLTYRASDGELTSDPVTVTIDVRPVNDAPVAQDVSLAAKAPTPADGAITATDVDGDTLTYSLDTQATNGTAVVRGDGTFTYTPRIGTSGEDAFTVLVSDGHGGETKVTVSVSVAPNAAPTPVRYEARVREDGTVTVNVLANDSDPEGGPLTLVPPAGQSFGAWYALPSGARVMWGQDGTVTYDPHGAFDRLLPGETAFDEVKFRVSDDGRNVVSGTLTITVYGRGGTDLVGYLDGEWWATFNEGVTTDRWATWTDAAWDALRQGDIDGDGHTDVLGLIDGQWYVGWWVAAGFDTYEGPAWANTDWRDIAVRDVNGDGKADLVGRAGREWWVSLSDSSPATGPRFRTATRWATWADAAWDVVFLDDLNADGRADLLGNLDGQWWAALSTGTGFDTAGLWATWANADRDAVGTFDQDGDGRADLYGLIGGEWWVSRSTSSGFETSLRDRWAHVEWKDVRAGDFDGDGFDDLAARDVGAWYVGFSSASTPQPRETTLFGVWANAAWRDVRVGDFDGDGRSDLIGRLDGQWWLAQSSGRSSTNRLWATWVEAGWQAVTAAEFDGYAGGPASGSVSSGSFSSAGFSFGASSVSVAKTAREASAPLALRVPGPVAVSNEADDPLALFWSQAEKDDEFADALLAAV